MTLDEEARLGAARDATSVNIDIPKPPKEADRLRQLLDMAFWHNEVGNIPGAVLACEAALKVDPSSTSALSLLGCLYEKQGKDDKAIEAFERVVQLNPDSTADYEKLEHLLRGIRDKALSPSLVHQLTPPVLLQATRKYPSLPAIAATVVVVVVLTTGIKAVWDHFLPATPPQRTLSALAPAFDPTTFPITPAYQSSPSQTAGLPGDGQQNAVAIPPPPPQYHDVFSQPGLLDRMSKTQSDQNSYSQNRRDARTDYGSSLPMPSYQSVKPLTVPASSVPTHVVQVDSPTTNDHVVMVNPGSQNGENDINGGGIADDGAPAPPPSHIFVTVHGDSNSSAQTGGTSVQTDAASHSISLRENAGASLQQKALNMQEAGNYKAAEATYEAAIAAYQQDIANGRGSDEAKRGIDACKVAVEICKQSQ